MRYHNAKSVRYVTAHDFDEQMWPINAMLFVFACVVGAVVVTAGLKEGRFIDPRHDPQPLYNAWLHLAVLGGLTVILLLSAVVLRRRVATRRMQLAIMLALLAQFLEVIGLWVFPQTIGVEAAVSPWMSTSKAAVEVTIPDYNENAQEQVTKDSINQPDQNPLTQQAQANSASRSATGGAQLGKSSSANPAAASDQMTGHETERVAMATSRPSTQPGGQISRSERADRLTPDAALAPTANAVTQENKSAINARTTPIQRQESGQPQLQRRPDSQPAAASSATENLASLDRRQAENPQATPNRPTPLNKTSTPENPAAAEAARVNAEAVTASSSAKVDARDMQRGSSASASSLDRSASSSPAAVASLSGAAAAQRAADLAQPSPQRASQAIAKSSTSPATTGDAASATAEAAAVRGSATSSSLTAGATTHRESAGPSGLPARGTMTGTPTAATQSPSFSATQLQRSTTSDSPQPGAASAPAQLARSSTTGGVPATGSAADGPTVAAVSAGTASSGGPQASQSTTRGQTGGQSAIGNPAMGGGNVTLPAEIGSLSGSERATAGQNVPTVSGRSGSSSLARSTVGERTGVPDARAEGPDVSAVAVQGNSPGLQSAPTGPATGRAANAGGSSVAEMGRGGNGGQPSATSGGGTAGAANIGRAGSGGNGEPTIASSGAGLRSGKTTGGLDSQAVAGATGDGTGGAPAAVAQGSAGTGPQAGGSGTTGRSQTSAGTLGERNAIGGPAGSSEGGVTVGAGNSTARAGGTGNQPQIGSAAQGMTKGTGSLAGSVSGGAIDAPDGPTTASTGNGQAGSGTGPAARATGRATDGTGTPGSPFGRGTAEVAGTGVAPSGLASGPNRATAGGQTGPSVASSGAGSLNKASSGADLPGGADPADEAGPQAGVASGGDGVGRLGPAASQPTRGQANSLIVKSSGPEGPGGLNHDLNGQLGVPNRLALNSSDTVQMNPNRFQLNKAGGGATLGGGKAELPAGWADRAKRKDPGVSDEEKAVEAALDFLARHQSADGRWSLHFFAAGKDYRLPENEELLGAGRLQTGDYVYTPMHSDTAATGLALLAFLGAGYTHQQGKYKNEVAAALTYLVNNQKANGDLYAGDAKYVWLYSHGIASIALCEAYGMTRDPALKDPAQKAVDFIVAAQSDEGGWRYAPKVGSDTSVSGWQVMALKSAQLAQLRVPGECFQKVKRWLDSSHPQGDASRYIYRPGAAQAHQNTPSPTMTAEALLMRLYLGWKPDHADLLRGVDYLLENPPLYRYGHRNCYYWYYATHLLVHVKGEQWNSWNEKLKKILVESQETQGPLRGSWNPDPAGRLEDTWGRMAGRVYNTAMHVLLLEAHYRRLPLNAETVTAP